MKPQVKHISPATLHPPEGYSHLAIVKDATLVKIAGQVGFMPDCSISNDFAEQVHQAFVNIQACLHEAGASPTHIVKMRHYIKNYDPSKMPALASGMRVLFNEGQELPCGVLIPVPSLADPRFHYEVEATIAIPARRKKMAIAAPVAKPQVREVDVVVVGAGLSGLQAAVDLQAEGLSCVVLEAIDRVGGKTLCVQASASCQDRADLGAAWINDTTQTKVWELAQKYRLQAVEQRVTGLSLSTDPHGTVTASDYDDPPMDMETFKTHLMPFLQQIDDLAKGIHVKDPSRSPRAKEYDSVTVEQYTEVNGTHPVVKQFVNYLTRAMLGVESREMSFLFYLNYIASNYGLWRMLSDKKDGGQYLRIKGGCGQFAPLLANELSDHTVHLSTRVQKVTQMQDIVRVEASNEMVFYCKRAIVTIPTPLYSTIQFEPELPAAKKLLSLSTTLGYYSKLALVFDRPWWYDTPALSGSFSSQGTVCFTRDTSIPDDNQWVITCFIVGEPGRQWSTLPEAKRREVVLSHVRTACAKVGAEMPEPVATHELEWTKHETFLGAPTPVTGPNVLSTEAGRSLRAPFGNVIFAGTEMALESKGFMDGALKAGSRSAAEVIALLK